MADLQAAVLPKPLSRVVRPVWPSNLPISKPALPTVASTTGYSNSWPLYRSTTELSLTSSLTDVRTHSGGLPRLISTFPHLGDIRASGGGRKAPEATTFVRSGGTGRTRAMSPPSHRTHAPPPLADSR